VKLPDPVFDWLYDRIGGTAALWVINLGAIVACGLVWFLVTGNWWLGMWSGCVGCVLGNLVWEWKERA
jgi:Na+/melibiose symporter-like transporter